MASPSTFQISLNLLFLLALAPLAFSIVPSSTSIASTQLHYWSKNVLNTMPKSIASKLSPLSKQDSLELSKPTLSSFDTKLCSKANLACSSTLASAFQKVKNGYNEYGAISTAHASDEADPNSFFRLSILRKGNKIQLPNLNDHIPSRAFLPSQIASRISTTNSNDLQKMFPEAFTSSATKAAIESSILYCSSPSLKSEMKSCPNSLENMIEFSKKCLGEKKLIALTSKSTKGSEKEVEIRNIKQFHTERVVSCHEIFFPFATYFCHLLSSSRLYAVDFVDPATKIPVNRILAICHMDTSEWPAQHVAFKILKFSPGHGEACHWFTQIDLVWMGSHGDNEVKLNN